LHSRSPVFFEDGDYSAYLSWLGEAAERYDCSIHAYVLMTNHVHILATPKDQQGISRMMQYVGRRYVPYINHTYGSSGSIWEGRYKASLVQDEQYLLTCMRYIELNPVRANMVTSSAHYRWSSYRANAQGKTDNLIREHFIYTQLGKSAVARQQAYKALFRVHIETDALDDIRDTLQSGTPLGNEMFRAKIEQKLGHRVGQPKRGRPKRALTP